MLSRANVQLHLLIENCVCCATSYLALFVPRGFFNVPKSYTQLRTKHFSSGTNIVRHFINNSLWMNAQLGKNKRDQKQPLYSCFLHFLDYCVSNIFIVCYSSENLRKKCPICSDFCTRIIYPDEKLNFCAFFFQIRHYEHFAPKLHLQKLFRSSSDYNLIFSLTAVNDLDGTTLLISTL